MVRQNLSDETTTELSEGDVVELTFEDGRRARYEVDGEFTDEDDEATGLKASRVWTLDAGLYSEIPRYRATLLSDRLVNNYADEDDEEEIPFRSAEVLSVRDRVETEGTLASSRAKHVLRVVCEAIENDPLTSTTSAESWTVKGADASGTGCLGGDLGVTVYCSEAIGLQVREAFEAYLYENLNEGTWFECERSTVWTFLYDDSHGTHALR